MQLVLDTPGTIVTHKDGAFRIQGKKGGRTFGPGKLDSIAITANVQLSAGAIQLAIRNGIPILFFDYIGKAQARLWSPYFESIATLRRQQVHFAESTEATQWMIDLFLLKTEAQMAHLKYLKGRKVATGIGSTVAKMKVESRNFENFRGALLEEVRQQMMGVEGGLARLYWPAVSSALPRAFRFKKRTRRPAKDYFNAAINYAYGMLYSVVEGGLFAAGLDPHLGLLHADEHRKPTLAFDMIEPFRPWADQVVSRACVQGQMQPGFFAKNQYGFFLNKHGKAFLIPAFNDFLRQRVTYLQQEATVKNHIYFLAARLAQRIRATAGE